MLVEIGARAERAAGMPRLAWGGCRDFPGGSKGFRGDPRGSGRGPGVGGETWNGGWVWGGCGGGVGGGRVGGGVAVQAGCVCGERVLVDDGPYGGVRVPWGGQLHVFVGGNCGAGSLVGERG